jgi:N utilization substance protein A
MSITFDTDTIRKINVFEEITGVEVKDCVINKDSAHFVVDEDKIGMAIGKNGSTVKKVKENLDRDVRLYGYSDDIEEFVENLVPTDINGVEVANGVDEKVATIHVDRNNRSRVVGRNGRNIKIIKRFLKREFDVDDVRVE